MSLSGKILHKDPPLPETFFSALQHIAHRSFIRSLTLSAATILFLLTVSGKKAHAADGDLDPTFGSGGKVMTDFNKHNDLAYGVALQPDGKFIVVGISFAGNSAEGGDFAVARYNPNGSLDTSFGSGGRVTTDFGLTETASSVAVQPDGKIVVGGGTYPLFPSQGGQFALARYNSNGSLDTSFGNGGLVRTSFGTEGCFAAALVVQADGKIIAAGTNYIDFSSDQSSNTDFGLVRYNPDGTLDATFGNGGEVSTDFNGFDDNASAVLLQPDGKIVAAGDARNLANFYDFAVARYLANGTLDSTFGAGGKVHTDFGAADFDQARSAVLQPDGKIVAAGTTVSNQGATQNFAIIRYTANGALDPTFGSSGFATIDFGSFFQSAYSVLLQSDGRIITVGYPNTESSDSDFLVARQNSNGSLDTTFGVGGKVRTSFGNLNGGANAAVLQPDGKIIAAGFNATSTQSGVNIALARYLGTSGSLQLSSAVSRKTHGSAGTFDVTLPLTGEPGVECRNSNGHHTFVFTFSTNVVSGNASVTGGTGSVSGNPVFSGNTMTVNLTGVTDVQKITVLLSNITSSTSQVLPNTSVSANMLIGDTTADKTVNNVDVSQTMGQVGQPVTSSNFREDVKIDGSINATDVRLVSSNVGHSLP